VSDTVSEREAARRAGVSPATLQRWVRAGLVPQARDGRFTTAAIAQGGSSRGSAADAATRARVSSRRSATR
jgi:predicted site-specific integrase-resolvase